MTLIRSVLESMEFKTGRMAELASAGWIISSDLASALVKERGLPWRVAHQIVAQLIRTCIQRGVRSQGITSELLDEIAEGRTGKRLSLPQAVIDRACNPLECVNLRQLLGGPAPEEVARQIRQCRRTADEHMNAAGAARDTLAKAEIRLAEAMEALGRPAKP